MPDDLRANRAPMQHQQPMRQDGMQSEMSEPQSGSKMPWVILGVIVIVLVVLGILFRGQLFKGANTGAMSATTAGSSGYQAVFLTNGQVYFGKMSQADSDYPVLTDVYYLQVVQPPLQGTPATGQAAAPTTPAQQPQISLVKLGNELHGPVDEMHISRPQILFYEDLKADGSVVKAIEAYKANPTGTPAAPTPVK